MNDFIVSMNKPRKKKRTLTGVSLLVLLLFLVNVAFAKNEEEKDEEAVNDSDELMQSESNRGFMLMLPYRQKHLNQQPKQQHHHHQRDNRFRYHQWAPRNAILHPQVRAYTILYVHVCAEMFFECRARLLHRLRQTVTWTSTR